MAENETLATKQFCDWERNYIIRPHHDNLANKEEKKKVKYLRWFKESV